MRIRVLCIGKLKERFYVDAALEFQKRLSRYASVELVELADARAPEQLSAAQREEFPMAMDALAESAARAGKVRRGATPACARG